MGVTSRLAAFAVETPATAVPSEVIERSSEMMLNAAGIGLAGFEEHEGRGMIAYVEEMGGRPVATVLGTNLRTAPELAALANGTLVHVMDFDENVERRANHPSNVMLPAVMAVGEQRRSSGLDTLAAFAIGCEISTKLGAAGDLDEQFPRMSEFGWQLMSVVGVFGATAAAGRLMGLTAEEMENAFGLACSQAAGVQVNHGTSSKSVQAGSTALRGIMCATLAQRGFTGARDGIEASNGFFGPYRRDTDLDEDAFFDRLGAPYDVIDPGVRLKVYPCGSLTHVSIEAMLRLIERDHVTPDEVQAINVSVPRRWDKSVYPVTHPRSGLEAKFSIAYCMAVAMVDGAPQIHHFKDEAVTDPRFLPIIDMVTIDTNEQPTERASRPSTVTVTLTDGRVVSYRAEFAKGHKENPVAAAEIDAKFAACARGALSPTDIDRAIAGFRTLRSADDVAALFQGLGRSAGS